MTDQLLQTPIVIEPAVNGVILSTGDRRKIYVLEPGSRSRSVHDLLLEVATAIDGVLNVVVHVTDPSGGEKTVATRKARVKLKETDVSEEYNIPVRTLQEWRRRGTGPAYEKVGTSVYYDRTEVEQFFRRHRIMTTGDA